MENCKKVESVEEYLSRGGKVTKKFVNYKIKKKKDKALKMLKSGNERILNSKFIKEEVLNNENFYISRPWKRIVKQALKKHGRRCQKCGKTENDNTTIHVQHIKPKEDFPELAYEVDNLQVLCLDCSLGICI